MPPQPTLRTERLLLRPFRLEDAAVGDAWDRQERVTFAPTSAADGILGAISLHLKLAHRRAELGYWVGQPFCNRGYATEATRAVIAFGFEVLGLNRIHASHLTRNPASGRVMAKSGMRFEGTLRQHVIKWERPEDLAEYAILHADMPAFGGTHT